MKPLEFVVVLLCVLLGLGRGADLAFATDAATGLCTAGAVWWRYLVLGAVVLAAVLAGRSRPLPPEPLRSRRPAAGVLAFAGAVCMLAAGAAQFVLAAGTVSTFVRILLEVACAVWLSNLGRSWLRHLLRRDGAGLCHSQNALHAEHGGAQPGALGTADAQFRVYECVHANTSLRKALPVLPQIMPMQAVYGVVQ